MEQKTHTITRQREADLEADIYETGDLDGSTTCISEPSTLYHITKRSFDILLALIGILVLMPLFLVIALSIKLDDGGAVLHFREIIGLHNRRFFALKFRTM